VNPSLLCCDQTSLLWRAVPVLALPGFGGADDHFEPVFAQFLFVALVKAYRERCGICSLRHVELLEASHILPDGHPEGKPVISNGIALCKLHHAAFDSNILGINPDYQINVREDILRETDGPMLLHGLQGVQGQKLQVPNVAEYKPNRGFLEIRYNEYLQSN
jgi:putative restriction endonuclease